MPNDLIDPPNDEEPWGVDFEGEDIWKGDEVVDVNGEYVPLEKARNYLLIIGLDVNTEEW